MTETIIFLAILAISLSLPLYEMFLSPRAAEIRKMSRENDRLKILNRLFDERNLDAMFELQKEFETEEGRRVAYWSIRVLATSGSKEVVAEATIDLMKQIFNFDKIHETLHGK